MEIHKNIANRGAEALKFREDSMAWIIQRMLPAQSRNQFPHGTASGLAYDVTDEEQFHSPTLMCGIARARGFALPSKSFESWAARVSCTGFASGLANQ